MGTIWLYATAAVAAGALLPVQAAINGRLRPWVGGALPAALASVLVSAALMLALTLASGARVPPVARLAAAPWWVWIGGLLGAGFVVASLALVARLGAAFLFALAVVGQMLASLVLDHFGLLGVPQHGVTPPRVLGAGLLVAGVVLIRRF